MPSHTWLEKDQKPPHTSIFNQAAWELVTTTALLWCITPSPPSSVHWEKKSTNALNSATVLNRSLYLSQVILPVYQERTTEGCQQITNSSIYLLWKLLLTSTYSPVLFMRKLFNSPKTLIRHLQWASSSTVYKKNSQNLKNLNSSFIFGTSSPPPVFVHWTQLQL